MMVRVGSAVLAAAVAGCALVTAGVAAADSNATAGSVRPTADLAEQNAPCTAGLEGAWLLVNVSGIKAEDGNVRVQVYGDDPEEFLASGKKLVRVDVATAADTMKICVPLPSAGDYALAVLHDRNGNGKADVFSEGFGFSNNPKLKLAPPDHVDTLFSASEGLQELDVRLTYLLGSNDKEKQARRKKKRR